jgi:hypothetical protein
MYKRILLLTVFYLFLSTAGKAQQFAWLEGSVLDSLGTPLEAVSIAEISSQLVTLSDKNGKYRIKIPANKEFSFQFSHLGCRRLIPVPALQPESVHKLTVRLNCVVFIPDIEVTADKGDIGTVRLKPALVLVNPSPTGDFNVILKTQMGVSSSNELSSQYNVRGGNYDENLVYVNDIEIYRPFLVRTGQQEGLSFVNPDLVSSIQFSAGGFGAKYGDKMSSVLDIKYKEPKNKVPRGSLNMNLLGASGHIEGSNHNGRFTYVAGVRHRSNQYLLNSLPVQGDYKPAFTDIQSYLTYRMSSRMSISWLANYARNRYLLVPQSSETSFGTATQALKLFIGFDGQELMQYQTLTNALSLKFDVNPNTSLKLFVSAYNAEENEYSDVEGYYSLDQLDNDQGSANFGKVKFNRGAGHFIYHTRNDLKAFVYNLNHIGSHATGRHFLQWGARYQREIINDKLSEWRFNDSAGFSVPNNRGVILNLEEAASSLNEITSTRITSYFQDDQVLNRESNIKLHYGIRGNFWDLNRQLLFSPRMQFSFEPNRKYNKGLSAGQDSLEKKDITLRAAVGYYYQPPFYRELRRFNGELNTDLKAQRSIHFVLGGDMSFEAWSRPFKFVTELYYKKLDNLVAYEIDNVRIRYYAENNSKGDAKGIDMKVNGEFIPGLESWASMSVMKVKEDIINDFYYDYFDEDGIKFFPGPQTGPPADSQRVEPGYIRRPSDQRVTFGLFFQDNLPKFPTYKMHLNLVFGTGLPHGPPDYNRYRDTLKIPPYRRVDIGFSKQLLDEDKPKTRGLGKYLRSAWLSAEVFNLLQIQNTISFIWVKDVVNQTYAVPNYLTSRRINLHLVLNF